MPAFPLGRTVTVLAAIAALSAGSAAHAQSAKPLAQEYVPIYHNTEAKLYVEGCGLTRLHDGTLLAVVPIVPRNDFTRELRMQHSHLHVMRSEDHGQSWKQVSELPYYSGKPWEYGDALYLFAFTPGTEFRNDDLLLLKSTDGGRTWSQPVTLFKGHFWNCDTGMVVLNDRFYWAMDDLSFGQKRGPCVISADLKQDLMAPSTWRKSNPVPFPGFPDAFTNPQFRGLQSTYLEPNVISINGHVRVLATVKPNHQATANVCAVFDLQESPEALKLNFTQFSAMPGGQLKFCVLYDDVSGLFWATANLVVDSQAQFPWWQTGRANGTFAYGEGGGGNDRRTLMLLYSMDGLNWFQAGCVAQAPTVSQSFMYARPVIDGDDLAIIARTSVAAPNQHDADYATFHRVKNFRRLALNLVPATK